MIAAYVTGHGFGHATRMGEVLRTLRRRAPDVPISVVTSGPRELYRHAIDGPFEFRSVQCDVGLAQEGALVIDEEKTAAHLEAFRAGAGPRVEREVTWLRERGARVVVADIPPLAFEAAAAAGVPAIGLANFSWDWIYRHYGLAEAADEAARAYAKATLLLQLPFAGDMGAFPRREPIPLLARRPALGRGEARRRLSLGGGETVALLAFGGLGLPGFDPRVLAPLGHVRFLTRGERSSAVANVTTFTFDDLETESLRYEDVVAAADVVVTKPGYGIVTDAIAARTRLVYTERGDFPEYPILVSEMRPLLPAVFVSNADLRSGRLCPAIAEVLALPFPDPPDLGGAERAAVRILEEAR